MRFFCCWEYFNKNEEIERKREKWRNKRSKEIERKWEIKRVRAIKREIEKEIERKIGIYKKIFK